MADAPLHAHSLAEAFLYLMITPCRRCGKGPLRADVARGASEAGGRWRVVAPGVCRACGDEGEHVFQLSDRPQSLSPADCATINDTSQPSRIIDVGQWIVLFRMIVEAAASEGDKQQARQLGLEAAQCLDEALKFYDEEDNDLPPDEAFFDDVSRQRYREHPQQFSRRRLVALRSKLPSTSHMRSRTVETPKRRWWRREG